MCPHLASAALDVEPGELTVLLPQVSSEVVLALLRLLCQGYLPLSNPDMLQRWAGAGHMLFDILLPVL